MSKKVLLKRAKVVNATEEFEADILIEDGKIAALGKGLEVEVDRTIDVNGRYLIPGGVDGHTHMMDPGLTEREDFTTGTRAALFGGITTVIDHHRTVPAVYSSNELEEKIEYLKDKSVADFGLKGGGAPDNTDKLKDMWERGVTGYKMFTCNLHGVQAMLPGFLENSFKEIAAFDGTVLIHCEDDNITVANEQRLKAEGRKDYLSHVEWRSLLAEKVAVETVLTVAMETGARVIIAHVSHPEILAKIKEVRDKGYRVYAESCPHYFYLTFADLEKKGPWVKFTPAIRMPSQEDLIPMWEMFNAGYVTTIGSDHCPYPKKDKERGEKNIWDAPNGIPGVETSMPLMLNAVNEGKTTLQQVVRTMCENPAKIYGLYPRKGVIRVGSDADLVILDMDQERLLCNEKVISKCGWTPFDGLKIKGTPGIVMLRGDVVVEDGEIIGRPGAGRFIARRKVYDLI